MGGSGDLYKYLKEKGYAPVQARLHGAGGTMKYLGKEEEPAYRNHNSAFANTTETRDEFDSRIRSGEKKGDEIAATPYSRLSKLSDALRTQQSVTERAEAAYSAAVIKGNREEIQTTARAFDQEAKRHNNILSEYQTAHKSWRESVRTDLGVIKEDIRGISEQLAETEDKLRFSKKLATDYENDFKKSGIEGSFREWARLDWAKDNMDKLNMEDPRDIAAFNYWEADRLEKEAKQLRQKLTDTEAEMQEYSNAAIFTKYGIDPATFDMDALREWGSSRDIYFAALASNELQVTYSFTGSALDPKSKPIPNERDIADAKVLLEFVKNKERAEKAQTDRGAFFAAGSGVADGMTFSIANRLADQNIKRDYADAGLDPEKFVSHSQARAKTESSHKIAYILGDIGGSIVSLSAVEKLVAAGLSKIPKYANLAADAAKGVQTAQKTKQMIDTVATISTTSALSSAMQQDWKNDPWYKSVGNIVLDIAVSSVGAYLGGKLSGKIGEALAPILKNKTGLSPAAIKALTSSTGALSFAGTITGVSELKNAVSCAINGMEYKPDITAIATNMAVLTIYAGIKTYAKEAWGTTATSPAREEPFKYFTEEDMRDPEVLKKKFRQYVRAYHPDRHRAHGPEAVEAANATFVEIKAEYERAQVKSFSMIAENLRKSTTQKTNAKSAMANGGSAETAEAMRNAVALLNEVYAYDNSIPSPTLPVMPSSASTGTIVQGDNARETKNVGTALQNEAGNSKIDVNNMGRGRMPYDEDHGGSIVTDDRQRFKTQTRAKAEGISQAANRNDTFQTGEVPFDGRGHREIETRTIETLLEEPRFRSICDTINSEISNATLINLYERYQEDTRLEEFDFADVVTYDVLAGKNTELAELFRDDLSWYFGEVSPNTDRTGREVPAETQERLKDSVVRDEDGRLIPVYHSTGTKFERFERGDIGYHFGSYAQARQRAIDNEITNPVYVKAYLNITNPLLVEADFQSWHSGQIAGHLAKMGILTADEAVAFIREGRGGDGKLRNLLKEKGYDGIIYKNDAESLYGTAYIVFDDAQVVRISDGDAGGEGMHVAKDTASRGEVGRSADKEESSTQLPTNTQKNKLFPKHVLPTAEELLARNRAAHTETQAAKNAVATEYADENITEAEYDERMDILEAEASMAGESMLYDDGRKYSIERRADNEGRSLLSDGSGKRADGTRAGEPIGIMAESTGGYQEGRKTAGERRKRTEALRADGLTRREKISGGKTVVQAEVIDEAGYNDEMRAISEENKKRGVSKTIIITGNAEISQGKGTGVETKFARGVFIRRANGETIVVVQYDNALYTPQQLNRHELVHMDYQTETVQKIKNVILNSLSVSQRRAAVRKLRADYAGMLEKMEDGAVEEFVCNILAGMSEYSQNFSEMATAYWNGDEATLDTFKVSEYTESTDTGGRSAAVRDGAGFGEEGNPRYSFAGDKAMTADLSLLETAKRRLKNGESKELVFKETGWFKSTDGMWRFEIDDSKARVFFEKLKDEALLSEILEHKDLYAAYPFLRDIKVKVADLDAGKLGYYDPGKKIISLSRARLASADEENIAENKKTLLHEVQHAVQDYEGFSPGGSTEKLVDYIRSRAQQYLTGVGDPEFKRLVNYGTLQEISEYTDNYIRSEFKTESVEAAASMVYENLHGEKEAWATTDRMDKTAPERKADYPDFGKGAMIPDDYEGKNIDDRISETEGNLPGGDFVDALLSDTGRRVQAAPGMAEKPSTARFSETEEGYLSSRFDDAGGSVPLEKDTDIRFSFDDDANSALADAGSRHTKEKRTEKLPVKAEAALRQTENRTAERLGEILGVPKVVRGEALKSIIREISADYLESGKIDRARVDTLFEKAWSEGVVRNADYYNQYKHIRDYLRSTQLTISEEDRSSIADFGDFRKRASGKLRIVNEGGLPVDSAYMELEEMAPELFPVEITHPADQLTHMLEIADGIRVTEETLDEAYGEDADIFKTAARDEFHAALDSAAVDFRRVKRYSDEQRGKAEKKAEAEKARIETIEEVKEAYKNLKATRRNLDKVMRKALLTDEDTVRVGQLLRGEINPMSLNTETDNVKDILAVYNAKKEYEQYAKRIREWNQRRKEGLAAEAREYLGGMENWKDKKFLAGLRYSIETMERNFRDVMGEDAAALIDKYLKPIYKGNAESVKLKEEMRGRVRALGLSRKVASGNLISEAHAVQLLGEAEDNITVLRVMPKDAKRDGQTLSEWEGNVKKLWAENPNLNEGKIRAAVKAFREIYDTLFEEMNEARVRNGYEPVNYRRGYFPHFQPGDEGVLAQFGRALGIDTSVSALPTTINGMTHLFRPGIQWFGNAKERLGFNTVYDAVEGFDKYIEGVSSVIYQTDNIQNLRALAKEIRYAASDEGVQKQVDRIEEREDLTRDEKDALISELYKDAKFALSNFVVELEEYTNLLANKKSRQDRDMEYTLGRKMYNIMQRVNSNVGGAMVSLNIPSWLANFIPLTQAWGLVDTRYLLRGMSETVLAYTNDADDFVSHSAFLTSRRGSDPLVKMWEQGPEAKNAVGKAWRGYQKAVDKLSGGMEYIDSFTADSIVRAKYLQNIDAGMSEAAAMEDADAFARGVMAGRSRGEMPTAFNATNPLQKLFTQFQLEVNNQYRYLFKDMPRAMRERGMAALAVAFLKLFLGAWIFDELYELLFGRRPAMDLLGLLNEATGDFTGYRLPALSDLVDGETDLSEENQSLWKGASNLVKNIGEELPFVGGVLFGGGRVPISSALPSVTNIGKALLYEKWDGKKKRQTLAKELSKPLLYMLPAGGQIKKIAEGADAMIRGGSYTVDADGNEILQYPVYNDGEWWETALNGGRAMLFGKTTLPTARNWVRSEFKSLSAKETELYKELTAAGMSGKEAFATVQEAGGTVISSYREFTDAGLTSENAIRLSLDLEKLTPEEGEETVSRMQRYKTVVAAKLPETETMAALATMMEEGAYEKLTVGNTYGVAPGTYLAYLETLPKYDADENGGYKQAEVKAALDAMGHGGYVLPTADGVNRNLTKKQKAVLWQLANKSWKPKNNPYDVEIGTEIYDALHAE